MKIVDLMRDRPLYIFGAGRAGRALYEAIPYEVQVFIDNDPGKWGRTLLGVPIVSPDILHRIPSEGVIIVSTIHYNEIKQQLLSLGFEEEKQFFDGYSQLNNIKETFQDVPYKVYDDIKDMTWDDYQLALTQIIEMVKERYQVNSAYTFGEISHLSISDLDMLLILNEPVNKLFEAKKFIQNAILSDDRLSYIFDHPPMLANEEMAPFLNIFHTILNIKKVSGNDNIKLPENDPFFYEKTMIWNYNFYRFFQQMMSKKKIGVREACLRLKNIAHSIQNNAIVAGEGRIAEADRIINHIREAAIKRNFTSAMLDQAIVELRQYFRETEPKFLGSDGKALKSIWDFTEPYLKLYEDIKSKKNPYIQAIDHALKKIQLSYQEVRQLIGAMNILDIEEYK